MSDRCPICNSKNHDPRAFLRGLGSVNTIRCNSCEFECTEEGWTKIGPGLSGHEKEWLTRRPTEDEGYEMVSSRDVSELEKMDGLQEWNHTFQTWRKLTPMLGGGAAYIRRPIPVAWQCGDGFEYNGQLCMIDTIQFGKDLANIVCLEKYTAYRKTNCVPLKDKARIPHAELLKLALDRAQEAGQCS